MFFLNIKLLFNFSCFFLNKNAKKGVATFDTILKLQKRIEDDINTLGSRAGNIKKVINYLYEHPMIDANDVSTITGLSLVTAYKIIQELENMKILEEVTGGKRHKLYIFREYLNLFKA